MSTPSISRDTIAVLVGSEDLASQYVHETGNIYMSRGHLAPKADFMYTSWQVIMLDVTFLRTTKERREPTTVPIYHTSFDNQQDILRVSLLLNTSTTTTTYSKCLKMAKKSLMQYFRV